MNGIDPTHSDVEPVSNSNASASFRSLDEALGYYGISDQP